MEEEVLAARRRVLGPSHPETLVSMHNLAGTLRSQKDLVGARRLYEELLEIRRSLRPDHQPDTVEEVLSLYFLGVAYRDEREVQKAADMFLAALEALEGLTGRAADSDDLRSTFKARFDEIYRATLMAFLDLGRTSDALHVLERYRAQSFLQMVSRRDFLLGDLPSELAERRRNVAIRYDRSMRELARLMTTGDTEGIAAVRGEQRDLRRERERIQAEIRRISPRLAEIEDPRPLTADEIRPTLDPGTLLLSYSVGDERTDLFVLSRDGEIGSYQLPIGVENLERQIRRFNEQLQGSLKDDSGASRSAMSKWLYERLIEPAADRIARSERLLIIPDGSLHYLPFAALVRTTADGGEEYLIEWKPVHTVLSATVLARLRTRRPVSSTDHPVQFIAFGNPSYPGADVAKEKGGGLAPLALVRSAMDRGLLGDLGPLPDSGREVTTIAGLFPEEATRIWTDQESTEERVKTLGQDIRLVHFAVHGVADPENPLDSFLAFTIPDDPVEGRDNGLLQAWEIFEGVRLDADLVVLSACQTAFGPQRGGEGLMSLSRAFQYAGARTVAASLWRVSDASTAELMIRFYRNLRDGKSKDEALRAAQIELIRGGPIEVVDEEGKVIKKDYSAPYHWAGFQLIGDWQ